MNKCPNGLHCHYHQQQHHFSFHRSAERAGDKGRERNTSTPNLQQHLACLFSGELCINRSFWPAIVCPVEVIPYVWSQQQ